MTAQPATRSFWRRLVRDRSLPVQFLVVGSGATALAMLAWQAIGPGASADADALLFGGLAATLAGWLLLRVASQRLVRMARQSNALERDELEGEDNFDSVEDSADLFVLSLGLRRLVQGCRAKLAALDARNAQLGQQLGQRSEELSTLQDLSIGLAAKSDLKELVDEALDALGRTIDYASASVWGRLGGRADAPVLLIGCRSPQASDEQLLRLAGSRLSRTSLGVYESIERDRRPVVENRTRQSMLSWLWTLISDDTASSALHRQTRSWMALPLLSRHEVVGVLRVDHHEPDYFDAGRIKLLSAVASQAALAIRHSELLIRERDVAVLTERNRIARDLHDAVSQTLFASNMIAGALARSAAQSSGPDAAHTTAQAQTLERLNRAALAEMRLLMLELKPDALEKTALAELLAPALEALTSRSDLQVTTALARGEVLAGAVRVHVYRIAQEALSNVGRHSAATRVHVEWRWDATLGATLHITDDGQGFEPELGEGGGFGLANMRSRATEIGASLNIVSAPGAGTELSLHLPPTPATKPAPKPEAIVAAVSAPAAWAA